MRYSAAFSAAATLFAGVSGHTWVEQVNNVNDDGAYFGEPGYIRGFMARGEQGFADTKLTYGLPNADPPWLTAADKLCRPEQVQPGGKDAAKFPDLQTAPGNTVAFRYLENGHVTLTSNQPGKPAGSGRVFLYGTTNPKPDETVANVVTWTEDGDLSTGRLINVAPYDDGRCYEGNASDNSTSRAAQNPPPVGNQIWCQNYMQIPEDVPAGKLTVYWVWQWPTAPGTEGLPEGKDEMYTSCMDFDIVDQSQIVSMKAAVQGFQGQKFGLTYDDKEPALSDFARQTKNPLAKEAAFYYSPTLPVGSNVKGKKAVGYDGGNAPVGNPPPGVNPPPGAGPPSGAPAGTGQPGQFAPSTMVTAPSPPAPTQPAPPRESGVVYVTRTETEWATTTVYSDQPTGGPRNRWNRGDRNP